ncbi:hypothetical protein DNTS_034908 [Danionella cerebrum]|uniref:protein-tyrosine-phosphatase n=1 Tax=Danionella cerebrum TaxID=2873325 RepID=A0A553QPW2_9TELE|nr:hypothetical protein DNTS_034908 [Danionella translucida]
MAAVFTILLEATVDRRGYIALDDILLLNYPCYKAPHFSRLGDVEVNAGQNATFQCVAAGRPSEAEKFLLERHNSEVSSGGSVKHLGRNRFSVSFQLEDVQRPEQDQYRCVTQSSRGSGVSNFAELIVKVPPSPIAPPQLLRAGSTYLIIQLNTNSILGDGPIIRREIEYRASQAPWSEILGVNMVTYKLWHLDPDTEYHISVLLTRPGEGGTGPPGPPLISRTKCAARHPPFISKKDKERQPGTLMAPAIDCILECGCRPMDQNFRAIRSVWKESSLDHLMPLAALSGFIPISDGCQDVGEQSSALGIQTSLRIGNTKLPMRRTDSGFLCLFVSQPPKATAVFSALLHKKERTQFRPKIVGLKQRPCTNEPMRALRGLRASEIQSRQLTLQWEAPGFNLTRCHMYSVSLCYRYTTAGGGGGHNTTVRECLAVEHNTSRFTLRDLPPFHTIQIRLALANTEGKKEGKEVMFQTEEDIPGGIAPESLTFTPLEDMIFLKWEEPVEPNGLITQYEISYQSIESSDPGINVPGPRRTVSKLRNETYHMFSNLHPGTTYLISVRARTTKGFGQTALTEITTNISAPTFDYGDMPSPLSETENTITVLLRPAQGRGAPVSTYQVVVEEEAGRKVKRELGAQDCFPIPTSHGEAQARGAPHYYTAELPPSSLPDSTPFTVGDNHTYNGYWNTPLDPRKNYLIYFQAMSNFRGELEVHGARAGRDTANGVYSGEEENRASFSEFLWWDITDRSVFGEEDSVCETRINCIRIARKAACKDHQRALEVTQRSEEMGLILGVCAGGLVVLILLLGAIIIIIKKGDRAIVRSAMTRLQLTIVVYGSNYSALSESSQVISLSFSHALAPGFSSSEII